MRIIVNGEFRDAAENSSLTELVVSLSFKPEQIAIELNQQVIRRPKWDSTILQNDDRVEIVHFVGGGQTRTQRQQAGAVGTNQ